MKTALKWILFLLIIFAIGEIFPGLGYYIHKIWKFAIGIVIIVVGIIIWATLTMDVDNAKYETHPLPEEPKPEKTKEQLEHERQIDIYYYEKQFLGKHKD